jgi:7-cyano-7-deazaguanine synthase
VQLDAPFAHATKQEVYELCRAHRVPLAMTYSCERRSRRPCGKCPSCIDRRRLGLA